MSSELTIDDLRAIVARQQQRIDDLTLENKLLAAENEVFKMDIGGDFLYNLCSLLSDDKWLGFWFYEGQKSLAEHMAGYIEALERRIQELEAERGK